jgi:hypothetical protein
MLRDGDLMVRGFEKKKKMEEKDIRNAKNRDLHTSPAIFESQKCYDSDTLDQTTSRRTRCPCSGSVDV